MKTGNIIDAMIAFFDGGTKRIAHALKVYGYALCIADMEGFTESEKETSAAAAILHDVGIKIAEDKFGSCTHVQQEELGPPAARSILGNLNISEKTIDEVCWIIARHHTAKLVHENPNNRPFRAIIEADFIVNFEEGDYPLARLQKTYENFFTTGTGKKLVKRLFSVCP